MSPIPATSKWAISVKEDWKRTYSHVSLRETIPTASIKSTAGANCTRIGGCGFLPLVPWIQAFIWAFKPTGIVDIRRFPREEAKGIAEEIARLKGETEKHPPKPADRTLPLDEPDPAE
jgi:hypothetical protein